MSAGSMTRLKVTKKRPQRNIALNVNGVNKAESPAKEHTPTPTRFIRTCEEVGLFQDLQNVNPFEEGFRKALNEKRTGGMEKTAKDDDSLHTPNILPHISNVYSLAEKDASPTMPEMVEIDEDSDDPDLKVDQEGNNSKLHILQLPERTNEATNTSKTTTTSQLKMKIVDVFKTNADYEVRRREMNRKAQQRSRHRRKQEGAAVGEEIALLRNENRKLKEENTHLLSEVVALRKRLSAHEMAEKCTCQKKSNEKLVKCASDGKQVMKTSFTPMTNGKATRPVPPKVKIAYTPIKSHLDPSKISKTYLRKERSIMPKISNVWSMATTSTSTSTSTFMKTKSTPSGFGLDLGNGVVVPLKLADADQTTCT